MKVIANPKVDLEKVAGNGRDPFFYGWRYVEQQQPDGSMARKQVPLTQADVLHPQEGDFIVTNKLHARILRYLANVFEQRLHSVHRALVLTDHRVDWQVPGSAPLVPDVAIFTNSDPWNEMRGTYPMRDMHGKPVCTIELTSPATRDNDLDQKVEEYGRAGVPFYIIVDLPDEDHPARNRLIAHRLTKEGMTRLRLDPPNRVWIPVVEVWLVVTPEQVLCLDNKGNQISTYVEVCEQVQEATEEARRQFDRAEEEKQRAEAAEARIRELEAKVNKPKRKKKQ